MTLPDAPLVPYHLIGFAVNLNSGGGIVAELSAAQLKVLNTENDTAGFVAPSAQAGWVSVVTPEIDLAGFVGMKANGSNSRTPQYSLDTTNGQDGTWSDIPGTHQHVSSSALFRDALLVIDPPIEGVRGVRYGTTATTFATAHNTYRLCHIYGFWNEPDHRLELWHPTLDERLTSLDAGILQRDVDVHDQDFRIKNTSTTLTANTITVQTDESKVYTPSNPSWHSLSDGGAFDETVEITSLAPEAISGVLTLRREPPDTVEVGYKRAWLRAVAASWTS